jgi:hypothetical protein
MSPRIYVDVYIGQTRAAKWIRLLESYGFGEMCVREEVPPRRNPWAFDNGAFKDWNDGKPFNEAKYQGALDYVHLHATTRPDFVVVPDIVAGGLESLKLSEAWVPKCRALKAPVYLVVQDGMSFDDVCAVLDLYDGIFVGGSLDWKLKTGRAWTDFAHEHGRKCHIGRMGTEDRVRAALRWGVDSIDSCLPLWSAENLARFLRGFNPELTAEMFPEAA